MTVGLVNAWHGLCIKYLQSIDHIRSLHSAFSVQTRYLQSITDLPHQCTMPFTLHPATTDDVSDIVAIYRAAFASDDIMGHFHPKAAASTLWEQDIQFYTDLIAQGSIYGERVTKAVDEETG